MGIEDILLDAAAEHEDEYDDEFDKYEDEGLKGGGVGGVSMSLKRAAQIVDKENEFDARESLKTASRAQQNHESFNSPRRDNDDVHVDESIEEKLRKADAKTDVVPDTGVVNVTEDKGEDNESEYESDEDEVEYEDFKDFLFCCHQRRINDVYRHLERGASIRTTDRHGWTPLHWVCAKGYDDVLEVLLKEYRGNVKRCINVKDDLIGFTALHLACVGGHTECMKILLDYNAKRLKNNAGELPIDVISVNINSVSGRKVAKIFGINTVDEAK